MGMGIVSSDDFDRELNNLVPSIHTPVSHTPVTTIESMIRPGRVNGDNNVPDSLRKIIGETSELEGRSAALELANTFGISPSSVSAYANGSTSTNSMDKQPNLDYINDSKTRVTKKAIKKLMSSLGHMTDEKMSEAKPHELAVIARHMSAVIKDMEPEQSVDSNEKKGPTFVFFAPVLHKEDHYETINVRE